MNPPWGKMLTSKAVWAIILAHFAENWGFYTLLTGLPMFMRGNKDSMIIVKLLEIDLYNIGSNVSDVLNYKLDQAGFLAACPYLLMAGIVQSAGVLADYARTKGRLTTTQVYYGKRGEIIGTQILPNGIKWALILQQENLGTILKES